MVLLENDMADDDRDLNEELVMNADFQRVIWHLTSVNKIELVRK